MKNGIILLSALFSISVLAAPGGEDGYIDGRPIHPMPEGSSVDYSELGLTRHYPGYRYNPSMVPHPQAAGNSSNGLTDMQMQGMANVFNAYASQIGHHQPIPSFAHLQREAQGYRDQSATLATQIAATQKWTQELEKRTPEQEALNQRVLEQGARLSAPPVIDMAGHMSAAADRMIVRKVNEAKNRIELHLRDYNTRDLTTEIQGWTTYSKEKNQTLDLIHGFTAQEEIFSQSTTVTPENATIFHSIQEAGISSLSHAAQITSGHLEGNFAEALGVSQSTLEIGKAFLDVAMGVTPGLGFGKDCYEALLGKSLIDGSELDWTSRSFAVLGVATVGGTTILKNSVKGLIKIGHALHARGLATHGLHSAIHVADSGITNIVRHTPIYPGGLELMPISGLKVGETVPRELLQIQNVAETFRSATYHTYQTTEPLTLYRLASVANSSELPAMLDLATTTSHHSRFYTRIMPTSPTAGVIESALERSWGSNANVWVKVEIPAGEILHEGVTASIQRIGHNMSSIVGGGNQVWIPKNIPKDWVKEVGSFK